MHDKKKQVRDAKIKKNRQVKKEIGDTEKKICSKIDGT